MAVPDQLTGQKLEENPLLPVDNQANLTYTLTRIFRLLAQIVNPLVAWAASWKNVYPSNAAGGTILNVNGPTPPGPTGSASLVLNKTEGSPSSAQIVGRRNGLDRWVLAVGDSTPETGGNAGSNFSVHSFSDAGPYIANPFYINRATSAASFQGTLAATTAVAINAYASPGSAYIKINKKGEGQYAYVQATKDDVTRWQILMGDFAAESGSAVGSNFAIERFANNGNYLGAVMTANRNTGAVSFPGKPSFQGTLGTETTGTKSIGTESAVNITNSGTTLTVFETGTYHVRIQQLMSGGAGGPALYLNIQRNGGTQRHGYASTNSLINGPIDIGMSSLVSMSAGDYLNFTITGGTAASTWTGPHASVTVHKVN